MSKIAEKAVILQLLNHCNEHAPLPTNQSSYHQFHSTETALIKVQSDILSSMDRQEVTLLVLPDLSTALDTVNHETKAALLESVYLIFVPGLMTNNYLMLNESKTEFLMIGSHQQLTKIKIDSIRVGSTEIKKVPSVCNLGVWFDTSMTMTTHIGKVCSKAFFGLHKIKQITKFLSEIGYC